MSDLTHLNEIRERRPLSPEARERVENIKSRTERWTEKIARGPRRVMMWAYVRASNLKENE